MKLLLAVAGILVVGTVSCQENELPGIQKRIDDLLNEKRKQIKPVIQQNRPAITAEQFQALIAKNNTDSHVINLPQDNMACIIPDMKQFNMPNSWTGELKTSAPGAIPNPGLQSKLLAMK